MIPIYVLSAFICFLLLLKLVSIISQRNCNSSVCLIGKTAIVTGGSSGIGYQIVLGLASRGCRVIIADCNIEESIKDTIFKETHNPNIILTYVNLASFNSVRKFADDIRKSEDKIDILVNNAGIGPGAAIVTEDGINLTMQVNYCSAFLMTHLLLDMLKKSTFGGRIIFTTSRIAMINFLTERSIKKNDIKNGYGVFTYPNSKFCQLCASEVFAEKLKTFGITSNCFHPHAAKTGIFTRGFHDATWYEYPILIISYIVVQIIGKTPEQAAQTGIYLACSNELQGITGQFFADTSVTTKPLNISNKKLLYTLWKNTEEVVKLRPEEKI